MTSPFAALVVKRNRTKNVQNVSKCNIVIENVNGFIGLHIKNCAHVRYQRQQRLPLIQIQNQNQTLIRLK